VVLINDDLSSREKTLLTLLGKDPDTLSKILLDATGYQYQATLSRKKKELHKKGYIRGPYYHINLNAVGNNELFDVYTDIQFDVSDYDFVFKLIQGIRCWRWIYPALQGDRFFVYFQSNYYTQISRLLHLIKKEGVIDYSFYSSQNRWVGENPDFFGEEMLSYDNLFEQCELPEMNYPYQPISKAWKPIDIRIMGYLQVRPCNIDSIQEFEQKSYGTMWKKNQINYRIQKLINYKIAERKHYNIAPYPRDKCFSFLLFVETADPVVTLQVLRNLGRRCRVYKAYTSAGETGILLCWVSIRNMPTFLSGLEDMEEIWIKAYQLKAHTSPYMVKQSFDVSNFDPQSQRWIFPYKEYRDCINHLLEERSEIQQK